MVDLTLKPCAHCGHSELDIYPMSPENEGEDWTRIECANEDCPMDVAASATGLDHYARAVERWNTRARIDTPPSSSTESGWLIEDQAGGFIHWIAFAEGEWPRTTASTHPFRSDRYMSPIRFVKDANEAVRFARQQDAEAFMTLFDRFLLNPKATEHEWPAPNTGDA